MEHLDAVTFDLGFTLIYETEEDEIRYSELKVNTIYENLIDMGFKVNRDVIFSAYNYARKFSFFLDSNSLIKLVLEFIGINLNDNDISRIASTYVSAIEKSYVPRVGPEALEALEKAKSLGLRVAVISNASSSGRTLSYILSKAGIMRYVDYIVSSSDMGYVKPHKRIFEIAVSKIGSRPEATVHIGDMCIEDYYGARIAGMRSILYTGLYNYRKDKNLHELCAKDSVIKTNSLLNAVGMLL